MASAPAAAPEKEAKEVIRTELETPESIIAFEKAQAEAAAKAKADAEAATKAREAELEARQARAAAERRNEQLRREEEERRRLEAEEDDRRRTAKKRAAKLADFEREQKWKAMPEGKAAAAREAYERDQKARRARMVPELVRLTNVNSKTVQEVCVKEEWDRDEALFVLKRIATQRKAMVEDVKREFPQLHVPDILGACRSAEWSGTSACITAVRSMLDVRDAHVTSLAATYGETEATVRALLTDAKWDKETVETQLAEEAAKKKAEADAAAAAAAAAAKKKAKSSKSSKSSSAKTPAPVADAPASSTSSKRSGKSSSKKKSGSKTATKAVAAVEEASPVASKKRGKSRSKGSAAATADAPVVSSSRSGGKSSKGKSSKKKGEAEVGGEVKKSRKKKK